MEVNVDDPLSLRRPLPHAAVLQALRDWRYQKAKENSIPAYWILPNQALAEIAIELPRTKDELLGIKGIGPGRVDVYGNDILGVVASHGEEPAENPSAMPPVQRKKRPAVVPDDTKDNTYLRPTRVSYPIPLLYWPSVLTAAHIIVPGAVAAMDILISLSPDPP